MDQRRRYGRIDAAAQAADDDPVADLLADARGRLFNEPAGRPCAVTAADAIQETAQDLIWLLRRDGMQRSLMG